MRKYFKNQNGLTLLEILLIIGLLVVLIGAIVAAINPFRHFAKTNNANRWQGILAIRDAILQNITDNRGYFSCPAGPIPATPTVMGSEAGQYNICPCLVPRYLPKMPVDPQYGFYQDCENYNTEYTIESPGVKISAPHAQLEEEIFVSLPWEVTAVAAAWFSLSVSPSSESTAAGGSVTTTVTASLTAASLPPPLFLSKNLNHSPKIDGLVDETKRSLNSFNLPGIIKASVMGIENDPWLAGWDYRRPITIDNTANSNNLTNYQVLVTLDTASLISAGKMKTDCGDIRFTDSDETTLIDYWLESGCNSANTRIWVEVPSIPASGTKTIYLYYGNPNATSTSSESATFISGEVEALTTKTKTTWGSGASYPEDTYNTYYHDNRNEIIYIFSDFYDGNPVYNAPIKIDTIKFHCYQAPGRPNLANYRIRYQITTATTVSSPFTATGWNLVWGPTSFTPIAGQWYTHNVTDFYWTQNNLRLDLTRDDSAWVSGGGMYRRTDGLTSRMCTFYSDSTRPWPFNGTCTVRNYVPAIRFSGLLRKYTSPEPTTSVGEEQVAIVPPTVSTLAATGITSNQATLNGEITDTGGEDATECGFDWDTNSGEPYANYTTTTCPVGTGTFSSTITGLNPNTTYYFRAKAQNSAGWGYGNELSFTTSIPSVTFDIASGLPTGATFSFSPPSCTPTCSSILTITTAATTPPGNYEIVITATGGGATQQTTYTLTVF